MKHLIFRSSIAFLLACFSGLSFSADPASEPASPTIQQSVPAPTPVHILAAKRLAMRPVANAIISLKNPSFEPDPQGRINAWSEIEHGSGHAYTFVPDPENALSAPSSARIRRHGTEPFALLRQSIPVHPSWHNRTVRLSGSLRGEEISGPGGALTLRVEDGVGQILDWNFMANDRVKDTRDWKQYSIELKIPPSAYSLFVGIMLEGGGTLWADDLSIELIN
uniref:Uncharacterized protein n=1 Tax=Candidatus Nitrotoga fabula TaxID=2182327 RepID=A0A2X0QY85_9PROT|nr:exported protein of unknown function [Candidatus Nitrotoga fabula]